MNVDIDGNDELRSTFGAKIVAHRSLKAEHESYVDDCDIITIGAVRLKVLRPEGTGTRVSEYYSKL